MNNSIVFTRQPMQYLYEDTLEITTTTERGTIQKSTNTKGPKVSLGMAQDWNLLELANKQGRAIPSEMLIMSKESDFYLAKLAITFHPQRDTILQWGQFVVYMRPEKAGFGNPIAFDLFPRALTEESKTDVKLGISPEIKFSEVEFKLGEVSTLFERKNIVPIMTGFGLLETTPTWEFKHHKAHPLQGSRECYLIIKKPRGAEGVRITLDATVDGIIANQVFTARRKQSHSTHCSQVICRD